MSRIVIVDDHPVLLEGLATLLSHHDHEIVAKCRNANEALVAVAEQKPDIIIADLAMGETNGLDLLDQLRATDKQRAFILYTGQISAAQARRAIDAGTHAIVSKDGPPDDILQCIAAVERGQNWIDRAIMSAAMAAGQGPAEWASLSQAEQRIAKLTVEGLRNGEIAEKTGLVEGTVKVHLNRIFRKLGITSRMALIRDYRDAA
jgi:DNA-binding NarL/FixJ family response regulator